MDATLQRPIDHYFASYSDDHRNALNQRIHVVAVPAILWSVVALGAGLLAIASHLVLEPPAALQADAVRDEKLKVLRSLKPFTPDSVARDVVRGQYLAGASQGQTHQGLPVVDTDTGSRGGPGEGAARLQVSHGHLADHGPRLVGGHQGPGVSGDIDRGQHRGLDAVASFDRLVGHQVGACVIGQGG